ncbi:molybdenum ABC transporter permease [Flavobacterium algicola]|nr:molybdenum ABC transporter permease [Flavobacterium algicola]MCG9793790.1 molybdenum ABC transporter permease [Flavobacterium algicola]
MNPALFLGIIALIIGVSLRYWINRRKFYRRSPMGVEGFSSFEKSVVITFFERVTKWISIGFIIFGLLMLWSYSRKKSSEKKPIQIKVENVK